MINKNKIVWGKPPSENISLEDCEWYHIMKVPGLDKLTEGVYDLRADIDNEKDLIMLNDFVKKFTINIDTKTKDIVNYLHKYKVSKDIIINTV